MKRKSPAKVIYKTDFTPHDVVRAYVAATVDGEFHVYAVNAKSRTLWTGAFGKDQIPADLAAKALTLKGHAFNQVQFFDSCPLWGYWQ